MKLSVNIAKCLILPALLAADFTAFCQSDGEEYQIKAAYIFNLSQFTEWPASSVEKGDSPFVVAIVGRDPFGSFIDELLAGEKKGGQPITVSRFKNLEDVTAAHIIFVSRDSGIREEALLNRDANGVLTIGESKGFAERGGMVEFYIEENKVKFIVNLSESKRRGLDFSSKVLRLAKICCN